MAQGRPFCRLFGTCGGCQYQDIPYAEELRIKRAIVQEVLCGSLGLPPDLVEPVVPSPRVYHYRCRIDLRLLRTRTGEVFLGFSAAQGRRLIPVEACPLALEPISSCIPRLKEEAAARLPPRYRNANIVVKCGDDGRVLWGGIGRRSLRLRPEDYLFTDVFGRRVFFDLESFFQANLSILPRLVETLRGLDVWRGVRTFYDLYGGVGLFSLTLRDRVERVVLVEENPHAVRVAAYSRRRHDIGGWDISSLRVEEFLASGALTGGPATALIDPPRAGLSEEVRNALAGIETLPHLLYLSCEPRGLARDLAAFLRKGWRIRRILPFDFFPRTRHIETLVQLCRREGDA